MQFRNHFRESIWLIVSLILAICLWPNLGSAQESGQDTARQEHAAPGASNDTDNKDAGPASPYALSWADTYIRQIGTSGVLAGNREGIGWGSLYIPSATVSGIVDQMAGTNTTPGATFSAAVLDTMVVFDHKIAAGRLALQYQPSMAIADGRVVSNFSNQKTSFDWLLYTRPRWNVRFGDGFRYYYSQQTIGLPYLDVNTFTSGAVTNNFLGGAGRYLSTSASISISYPLSTRSSISVTPKYTSPAARLGVHLSRGSSYGASVSVNYRTTERHMVSFQSYTHILP